MIDVPMMKFRPERTPDGEGGVLEDMGTPTTIWGDMLYHQNVLYRVLVLAEEDVRINDIIVVPHD